jgi:hypothetical protein
LQRWREAELTTNGPSTSLTGPNLRTLHRDLAAAQDDQIHRVLTIMTLSPSAVMLTSSSHRYAGASLSCDRGASSA